MKPILFGILATTCLAFGIHAAEEIANKEEYLKGINDMRREYAKKSRIPNMHKLVWDDHLEDKSKRGDYSGYQNTCRSSKREGSDITETHAQDQINYYWSFERRDEFVKDYMIYHMNGNEDLTPGQQKIGCAPHYSESKDPIQSYGKLSWKTLCFMEPEGTGESWKTPQGEAGSACPEGFENDDGLCAVVTKSAEKSNSGGSSVNETASFSGDTTEANGSFYMNLFSCMILFVIYQNL